VVVRFKASTYLSSVPFGYMYGLVPGGSAKGEACGWNRVPVIQSVAY